MNRDWNDFKALHSNIAGAREAFEDACETLFRSVYPSKHVSKVKVSQGDGGIDVFIGELGIEPITVIQCKFFLDTFNASQQAQIRASFNTAITSSEYEVKEWILCVPRIIDINENSWWFKWKHKKLHELSKDPSFIQLYNGSYLIDLLKQHNLYTKIFKIDDTQKLDKVVELVTDIHKVSISKTKHEYTEEAHPKVVLFNNYSEKCELYYLHREADNEFLQSLKINNLWVFGKSGSGKTALINRNLIQNNFEYCFCDCSPIDITSSTEVLQEIICKVEERFTLERNINSSNLIKQLTQLLCCTGKRKIVIVIDELSVKDHAILKAIATDLLNLVVHFSNSSQGSELKFVISTISKPIDLIENTSKAADHFLYLDSTFSSSDIGQLFDKILKHLGINLSSSKDLILQASENSPRTLKSILRKIIATNDISENAVKAVIDKIKSEIVN
jgi:hypothetical protein